MTKICLFGFILINFLFNSLPHVIAQESIQRKPEDQAVLDKAKAEHSAVIDLWEKKHATFKDQNVQEWLNKPAVPVSKKKRIWMIIVFTIAISAGLYLLNPRSKKTISAVKTIELQLQNGTVIDLSQDGKETVGNISLTKQQGGLTYTSNADISEEALLSVPAGKNYKVTLSDGTVVVINAATTLSFPTSFNHSTNREITINGEAYLKVAQISNRPFIVKIGEVTVQVLGTEFNVNSYNKEHPEVALVEGKVRIKIGKDSAILHPGVVATYVGDSIQIKPFDENDLLGWRQGFFLFDSKTLEDILKDIQRIFGQEVILDDPDLGTKRFGGTLFRNKSIQKNLELIKMEGMEYYIDKDNVIHIKKNNILIKSPSNTLR